ncbi:MAG: hypothetical protein J5742_03025 [Alphaproteobacteria bacterium]|nr:hypothetical protein [Alphaproteobacteria bacterium]
MKRCIAYILGIVPVTFVSNVSFGDVYYYEKYGACEGLYLNIPTSGCGTTSDKASKISASSQDNKDFDGFYLNGEKIVDVDGTIYGDISKLEQAGLLGEDGATLSATYYDSGTVYLQYDSNTGDIVEANAPTKGRSTCDAVKIVVYPHKTDQANTYGTCNASKDGAAVVTLYYKKGEGYFTDAARTQRVNDANYSGGTNITMPTNSGYRLRGFFTSKWPGMVTTESTTTGAAYVPLNTTNNGLYLRAPNWVVSTNTSCGKEDYYPMPLCAGWAKECADSSICSLDVKNVTASVMDRGDVTYTIGQCKTGTLSGSGANATCTGTTPPSTELTRINLRIYNSSGNATTVGCTIGSTNEVTIPSSIIGETIVAFRYKGVSGDSTVFYAGSKVPCQVGTNGFSHGTTSGTLYTVELEPLPKDTDDGNKVDVVLNTGAGTIGGSTSVEVDKGGSLGDYSTGTRVDGAEFVGWYEQGKSASTASRTPVVSSESAGTVVYNAAYHCPDGTEANDNGVCVEQNGEYLNPRGETVPPSQLTCWRLINGEYKNYCYWKVNMNLHDKPSGNSTVAVRDGNDGLKLACYGGKGCKVVSGNCCVQDSTTCNVSTGNWCRNIRTPHANNDYTFRGYFMDPVPQNVVTQISTTEGGAFNNFFPKNLNNVTISVTGHAIVVMSETEVPIICEGTLVNGQCDGEQTTAPITIDVYGGWARNCAPGENANCTLKTGIWWDTYDNLGKGDVRYDTSCNNGYTVSDGGSTYNPTCERESGNVNITYAFKDQWGNNVSCSGPTQTCSLGDNFSLTGVNAVQTACGSNYTLKYLITNKTNWYHPNKMASCSTNEFGTINNSSATIMGTVCNNFCTIGQYYSDLHGTCVAINQGDTQTSLGVSMPRTIVSGGTTYYVVSGSYMIENLWDGCPTLQCDSGYGINTTLGSPTCILKGSVGDGSSSVKP